MSRAAKIKHTPHYISSNTIPIFILCAEEAQLEKNREEFKQRDQEMSIVMGSKVVVDEIAMDVSSGNESDEGGDAATAFTNAVNSSPPEPTPSLAPAPPLQQQQQQVSEASERALMKTRLTIRTFFARRSSSSGSVTAGLRLAEVEVEELLTLRRGRRTASRYSKHHQLNQKQAVQMRKQEQKQKQKRERQQEQEQEQEQPGEPEFRSSPLSPVEALSRQ